MSFLELKEYISFSLFFIQKCLIQDTNDKSKWVFFKILLILNVFRGEIDFPFL